MHKYGVSWRYFVFEGSEPDCEDDEAVTCAPVTQGPKTSGIWNPLVDFGDVKEDGQLGDVQSLTNFYSAVQNTSECGLPNVSWITPNDKVSEHPPALVSTGQAYVTTLINSIMRSPCWGSTAIFLSWDDWGGFYDNVVPLESLCSLGRPGADRAFVASDGHTGCVEATVDDIERVDEAASVLSAHRLLPDERGWRLGLVGTRSRWTTRPTAWLAR